MRLALTFVAALALCACASVAPEPEPSIPEGAVPATHTETNGDVITEYRVAGQLRMVRVEPARGPVYYLIDRNGDGRLDGSQGDVSPVYYKLFEWN